MKSRPFGEYLSKDNPNALLSSSHHALTLHACHKTLGSPASFTPLAWMPKPLNTSVHINEHMFEIMNIFSKPSIQIIQYLGRRYREGYYVRELSRNLGIGLGSASQSLRGLEEAGLVLKEKKGRLVIYRADMGNPLLRQFKLLFTLIELDPLISNIKEISSKIIVFGSTASGEDTQESDIDIFIAAEDKKKVSELIESFQKRVERKVSPIIMNTFEFRNLATKDKPLYERINMGKIIYEV